MKVKPNFLFVCSYNRMRSATAEEIFANDPRFTAKSAGTDETAVVPITKEILEWADTILVMENYHGIYIRSKYPHISERKKIICLNIPDVYDFMQSELVSILKRKVDELFGYINHI